MRQKVTLEQFQDSMRGHVDDMFLAFFEDHLKNPGVRELIEMKAGLNGTSVRDEVKAAAAAYLQTDVGALHQLPYEDLGF